MSSSVSTRDGFSSRFGVLAATLGSAVGLGNIWAFPYQTGSAGGAGFLVVYLLATLLVGLPLMIAEISIGRSVHTDSLGTYLRLAPGKRWWIIAAFGLISVMLIMAFYSEVMGWVFAYVFKSFGSDLMTTDRQALKDTFGSLVSNPMAALGWQWAVLGLVGFVITLGVTRGIEAVTKRLMPILLALLFLIALRSLSLPGAMKGVEFLFLPDFSKINADVILRALGLAFFKLSLAVGSMTIYGSYFREEQNIPQTALTVMLADLCVSLLAGLAIFPAVFALGFDPARGPALLFETLPAVFSQMPFGQVLMAAFFTLTTFAAIGAMLSLLEVPVAVLHERLKMSRPRATWLVVLVLIGLGALASLSSSTLAHVHIAGMNFFDAFDFASSKLLMPITGLLTSLFVAFHWGKTNFIQANSNGGTLHNQAMLAMVFKVLVTVTPLLISVILVWGLIG